MSEAEHTKTLLSRPFEFDSRRDHTISFYVCTENDLDSTAMAIQGQLSNITYQKNVLTKLCIWVKCYFLKVSLREAPSDGAP